MFYTILPFSRKKNANFFVVRTNGAKTRMAGHSFEAGPCKASRHIGAKQGQKIRHETSHSETIGGGVLERFTVARHDP